ncbi:hypothetical protein CYMTET_7341, partial [Cymbomonas tetramitiformis]
CEAGPLRGASWLGGTRHGELAPVRFPRHAQDFLWLVSQREQATPPPSPPPPRPPPPGSWTELDEDEDGPRPERPTLKLFWQKLPESAMQQTFWQQCAEAEKPVLDYGGLEEHFAAKKPKGVGGEIAQGARSTKTLLLDLQRSNNSAIFLAKLGRTPEAVCEGILRVDEELLTEENITGLLKCIPTPEEAATLGTYEGSTENLGVVERLMIHLLRIPMAEERLKAVRFQRHFHGQLKAVQAAAAVLHAAAQEVQRSALLPMILHIVLAAGNFLNTGSRNGNAVGFRLEVLPKLRLVKATSGSVSTLLHFVVASARKEQPSSPALKSELQHAGQASHLNLQLLWSEVANIRANLDDLSRTLDVVGGDGTDPFQGELSALSEDAAEQLEEASAQLQAAEMCFKELAMYLDGAAGRPDPQAFFSMLDAFADDFDRADAENAIQDAEREAVARRRRSARGHLRSHSLELGALCGLEAAPAGQLRQKDNVLVAIKAFAKLKPRERRSLLMGRPLRQHQRRFSISCARELLLWERDAHVGDHSGVPRDQEAGLSTPRAVESRLRSSSGDNRMLPTSLPAKPNLSRVNPDSLRNLILFGASGSQGGHQGVRETKPLDPEELPVWVRPTRHKKKRDRAQPRRSSPLLASNLKPGEQGVPAEDDRKKAEQGPHSEHGSPIGASTPTSQEMALLSSLKPNPASQTKSSSRAVSPSDSTSTDSTLSDISTDLNTPGGMPPRHLLENPLYSVNRGGGGASSDQRLRTQPLAGGAYWSCSSPGGLAGGSTPVRKGGHIRGALGSQPSGASMSDAGTPAALQSSLIASAHRQSADRNASAESHHGRARVFVVEGDSWSSDDSSDVESVSDQTSSDDEEDGGGSLSQGQANMMGHCRGDVDLCDSLVSTTSGHLDSSLGQSPSTNGEQIRTTKSWGNTFLKKCSKLVEVDGSSFQPSLSHLHICSKSGDAGFRVFLKLQSPSTSIREEIQAYEGGSTPGLQARAAIALGNTQKMQGFPVKTPEEFDKDAQIGAMLLAQRVIDLPKDIDNLLALERGD